MKRALTTESISYGVALIFGIEPKPEQGQGQIQLSGDIREFLVGLFGDAVRTVVAMSSSGLKAVLPGTPSKIAEIGPGRVTAVTPTATETARAVSSLWKYVAAQNLTMKVTAYGLNYEFEFGLERVNNSSIWLAEHFIRPGIRPQKPWKLLQGEVGFTLRHTEGMQRTYRLQARAGKPQHFYCLVNAHHDGEHSDPTNSETWVADLTRGYDGCKNDILELLKDEKRKAK